MSVDEMMVQCYGRHRGTVIMPHKPVSHGFKLWAAARRDGYVLHLDLATNVDDDTLQFAEDAAYSYHVREGRSRAPTRLTGMDLQTAAVIRLGLGNSLNRQLVAVDNFFMSP